MMNSFCLSIRGHDGYSPTHGNEQLLTSAVSVIATSFADVGLHEKRSHGWERDCSLPENRNFSILLSKTSELEKVNIYHTHNLAVAFSAAT